MESIYLFSWRNINFFLTKRGNSIQLFPEKLFKIMPTLPHIFAGITLAEETPGGLELSHEFCSRFENQMTLGSIVIYDPQKKAWLRGEDLPSDVIANKTRNRIVILRDQNGDFLGRGRVTSERIKNLLPRRVLL